MGALLSIHLATAWWKYNPILQKPTTLEPVKPWSWFWYYGPDPAAGCSYGQYQDPDNAFDIIHEQKDQVLSPASGKPMKFVSSMSYEDVCAHLDKVIGKPSSWAGVCKSCKACLSASVDLSEAGTVFCSLCGGEVEKQEHHNLQGKTMNSKITALKNQIRTSANKRSEELSAEAKVKARRERVQAAIKERIQAKREKEEEWVPLSLVIAKANRLKAKAAKKAKAESEEFVSLDEILEAMNEVKADEEGGSALEKAAEHLEEAAESLKEHAQEEALEPEHGGGAMPEAPAAEEAPAAPAEEASDEYVDLDMVISMLNKKEALARRRRLKEVAAKIKQAKAEAPESPEDIKADPLFEETKADEEPEMVSEENPAVEEVPAKEVEEAEGMRFESLASPEAFAKVRKEDIDMTLYGENTDNPTWNVTVAGIPAARIQLKAQASAEDIRAAFCSDDYALDLIEHCAKSGFVPTMNKVSAQFWANHTSNKQLEDRLRAKAEASFKDERKTMLASFRNEFMACLNIVTAGINKNFFPAIGNPLKDHLFANLTMVGLPEQTAISSIEKSFQEGSSEYFRSLFDKAQEYMDMPKEVRAEMASAIGASNYLDAYASKSEQVTSHATLADRVAQASVIPASNGGGSSLSVTALKVNESDFKTMLKAAWKGN